MLNWRKKKRFSKSKKKLLLRLKKKDKGNCLYKLGSKKKLNKTFRELKKSIKLLLRARRQKPRWLDCKLLKLKKKQLREKQKLKR